MSMVLLWHDCGLDYDYGHDQASDFELAGALTLAHVFHSDCGYECWLPWAGAQLPLG